MGHNDMEINQLEPDMSKLAS
ncbi:uncharacterized protein G2W53_012675 [Senna tora]|uniref:Uncharacterized protein n=1 Tax=Senna tora TaxID=362788 RepID=A0A834TY03_9FABA|nr:uncharacterized protein G2W53_012675 [Senna tora]